MVRSKFLLMGLAASIGLCLLAPTSATAASVYLEVGCSIDAIREGTCPQVDASVGDGGVDVSAGWEEVSPGSGGGGGAGPGSGADGGSDGTGEGGGSSEDILPKGVSRIPGAVGLDRGDASPGPGLGPRRSPAPVAPPEPGDPAVPACEPQTPCDPALVVRVRDLVSIQAAPPTQGMEPNGWLVVGIPTNFYASASTHTSSGSLLGAPADVRFTPVAFTWKYGDGTSGTFATGGASWAALGLTEFSETSTSHVYKNTGTVSIDLSVSYAAEYRFAGGEWRAVEGLLTVPGNAMTAIADRAGTVLVAEGCGAAGGGPGCR
jgi:hypothetical protein